MANDKKNMKQLVAAIERGDGDDKKTYWTRIGIAFENRDGSWNLRFDYVPARMGETTVQLRAFDAKDKDKDADKAAAASAPPPSARQREASRPREPL